MKRIQYIKRITFSLKIFNFKTDRWVYTLKIIFKNKKKKPKLPSINNIYIYLNQSKTYTQNNLKKFLIFFFNLTV